MQRSKQYICIATILTAIYLTLFAKKAVRCHLDTVTLALKSIKKISEHVIQKYFFEIRRLFRLCLLIPM